MAKGIINIQKLTRDLVRIDATLKKVEDIATTRSLNLLTNRARIEVVDEVAKEYGYQKNSIKRRMIPIKATRFKKVAGWDIKSVRLAYPKPKKIKGGISYAKKGGGRAKITERPRGGSTRPFLVTATKGKFGTDPIIVSAAQKKVAVYRKSKGSIHTTTFLGSSVPKMVESVGIDDKFLIKYIRDNFAGMYREQIKKAAFKGKR